MLVQCIDIEGGKVVQRKQGKETVVYWDKSPAEQLEIFLNDGFEVDVIDLERGKNRNLLEHLCEKYGDKGKIRIGGGLKTVDDAKSLLDRGAYSVIFSSKVFDDKKQTLNYAFIEELIKVKLIYGKDSLTFAPDIKGEFITIYGWDKNTKISIFSVLPDLAYYVHNLLIHNVLKEGMMQGTNIDLYKKIKEIIPDTRIIAAGGITDLKTVDELHKLGIDAVIGMALYSGKIPYKDMIEYKNKKL